MGYKTISMIVTDAGTDGPALEAAAALAMREEAHLDVACVGIDPARYEVMPAGSAAIVLESGAQEARERAEALVAWAENTLPSDQERTVVHGVVSAQMGLESAVSRLARYSDLIVATQPYGEGRTAVQIMVTEAALFGTGAPVLIIPQGDKTDYAKGFQRPLVAWNESDEALSVIRKSTPVLEASSHVDIVMVDPPGQSPERSDPGGAISLMLARRGIKAEVSILAKTLPTVAEVVERFAREHANDLIVMGAYGHSRFREALFGGATRDMFARSTLPMLMAH